MLTTMQLGKKRVKGRSQYSPDRPQHNKQVKAILQTNKILHASHSGHIKNLQPTSKINIVSHESCSLTNEDKSKDFSRLISSDLEKSSLLKQVSEFMSPHRLYNASLSPTVNASQQICPCLQITTTQPTTFYQKCQMSGYSFLIDTGACRSFVPKPPKTFHLQPYIGPVISTADGQPLKIE